MPANVGQNQTKMNTDLRYHLVLGLKIKKPKVDYTLTLGYPHRYQVTNVLKLARNCVEAGNCDQIHVDGAVLYSAEGIDTHTGASIGKHEA